MCWSFLVNVHVPEWVSDLKASIRRSTFWASPCTLMCAWNLRSASSSSMAEKSISSTTQLRRNTSRKLCCWKCSQTTISWKKILKIKKNNNNNKNFFCGNRFIKTLLDFELDSWAIDSDSTTKRRTHYIVHYALSNEGIWTQPMRFSLCEIDDIIFAN